MPRNEHFIKMNKKVVKGSKTQLPAGRSSTKDELVPSYKFDGKEHQSHDDGEHFEFELFKVFKIKCKRVTKNVVIVIALLALAVLLGIIYWR
jgi:hypothetical protein